MDPLSAFLGAGAGLAVCAYLCFRKANRSVAAGIAPLFRNLGPEYIVRHNVVLATDEGMIQIDHMVVSPYGVFVIDEEPEKGRVEVHPSQREWPVKRHGQKSYLGNPLWRNRKAVNFLQEVLEEIPFIAMVVFPHARLEGQRNADVLTSRELLPRIRSFSQTVLSTQQQQRILQVLGVEPSVPQN